MARRLKTYTTSIGFYDLAIAAPSMKAALEAWGSPQNLFHLGLAQETDDPDIVAATLAAPGEVLRRAVGTGDPFARHAAPPRTLSGKRQPDTAAKPPRRKAKAPAAPAREAAVISFEKACAARERARRAEDAQLAKDKAAQDRAEAQRQKETHKAQAALDQARKRHDRTLRKLEAARRAAEERLEAERARWRKQEHALQAKLRE